MYIYKTQVSLLRGIATLVAVALVLWTVGTHLFTTQASAANLTNIEDLLTDSAPDEASTHTITFTTPNGMATGETFTVDFPAGFDLSSLTANDVSMTVDGNSTTTAGSAGVDTWGITVGSDFVQFDTPTNDANVASSSVLVLTIGDEAGNQIVNPSATSSYEISVGTSGTSTIQDNGQVRVAIIENVLVTADINTTLTFTVNGTSTGAVCNDATEPAFATSTNTTLPFGTLSSGPGGRKNLCQDLTVATNAINGYVVTVEQDTQLQSSTGADIDGFVDGNWTNTPTAWASPSNNVGDEDTWGHWGLTTTDATTTHRASEFGTAEYIAASSSPRAIMGHDGPADGVTDGVGRASVGYSVEITALQEAGDDYNTTLTYIATPTF